VKLIKHIRYLVRVHDYETVHVEVGAEVDHHDLGLTDDQWAEVMTIKDRQEGVLLLQEKLNTEVEKLAREELERIATWSEISPNLAEDFLSSNPLPTTRSQSARTEKTDPPPASRRLRRDPGRTPPPAA
jgi:hypothetical protein